MSVRILSRTLYPIFLLDLIRARLSNAELTFYLFVTAQQAMSKALLTSLDEDELAVAKASMGTGQ
jgi:hypothetical protein